MNEFTENVISYISGFVIKVIQKQIRCSACIEALRFSEVDEADRTLKLISRKTRGGLIIPSHSVREVCRKIEKKNTDHHKNMWELATKRYIYKTVDGRSRKFVIK